MSEKTKTEKVRELLAKYSSIEEMRNASKDIAEKVGCNRGLVYKQIRKLEQTMPSDLLPEAKEPVIKIPKAIEVEIEPEEEEETAEEIEDIEEPEESEPEIIEPIEEEEEAEETEKRLGDIFNRSIERLLNIPISELDLKLISKQEAEDSAFLILLMFGKYTDFQSSEDMLEGTSVVHFSSLGIRAFIQWYKERRAKKQAEEREKKEQKEEPRAEESKPEAAEESEAETEKPKKETEPHFKDLM